MTSTDLNAALERFEQRMATRPPKCGACGNPHIGELLKDGDECATCQRRREERELKEASRDKDGEIEDLKAVVRAQIACVNAIVMAGKDVNKATDALIRATDVARAALKVLRELDAAAGVEPSI